MSCTGLYANSPLVVWCNICITEICKCFVFILEYTNPCLEENSISSDPQTHTYVTDWESERMLHAHTHIIIYLPLGGPLTHSYALTLHACMQPTMNTCPLPHYLMITAECQERLTPEAQWLWSATDTKTLFQTLVNVYCFFIKCFKYKVKTEYLKNKINSKY